MNRRNLNQLILTIVNQALNNNQTEPKNRSAPLYKIIYGLMSMWQHYKLSEIAAMVGVSSANACNALRKLKSMGLVKSGEWGRYVRCSYKLSAY